MTSFTKNHICTCPSYFEDTVRQCHKDRWWPRYNTVFFSPSLSFPSYPMMGDERRRRKREDALMEGKKGMQHCQGMSIDSELLGVWKESFTNKSNDYHFEGSKMYAIYRGVALPLYPEWVMRLYKLIYYSCQGDITRKSRGLCRTMNWVIHDFNLPDSPVHPFSLVRASWEGSIDRVGRWRWHFHIPHSGHREEWVRSGGEVA